MKRNIVLLLMILLPAFFLSACSTDGGGKSHTGELLLACESVRDAGSAGIVTKAQGDEGIFFADGDKIIVQVTCDNQTTELTYEYNMALNYFFGSPGYKFALNDKPVTVCAIWPETRANTDTIPSDQRKYEDFKRSDWMTAVCEATDKVMPTDSPVPLNFVRENIVLEFQIAGQYVNGLKISELLLEIIEENGSKSKAYFGYCDPDGYNAQIILPADCKINRDADDLLGIVRVIDIETAADPDWNGKGGERHSIYIKDALDWEFEAGHRYVVILTPTGNNVYMAVFVGNFDQTEGGLAVPFPQPVNEQGDFDINGYYFIETRQQLIAMSYLIRHYTPVAGNSVDWLQGKYVIMDTLMEELRRMYREDLASGTANIAELAAEYYPENTPNTIGHGGFKGKIHEGYTDGATGTKSADTGTDLVPEGILLEEDLSGGGNDVYFKLIYEPV